MTIEAAQLSVLLFYFSFGVTSVKTHNNFFQQRHLLKLYFAFRPNLFTKNTPPCSITSGPQPFYSISFSSNLTSFHPPRTAFSIYTTPLQCNSLCVGTSPSPLRTSCTCPTTAIPPHSSFAPEAGYHLQQRHLIFHTSAS